MSIYLTGNQIADLIGKSKQAVLKRAKKEKWIFVKESCLGGYEHRFLLSDLPQDIQQTYKKNNPLGHASLFQSMTNTDHQNSPSVADLMAMTAKILDSRSVYAIALATNIQVFFKIINLEGSLKIPQEVLNHLETSLAGRGPASAADQDEEPGGVISKKAT